jgi:hypothetical protein
MNGTKRGQTIKNMTSVGPEAGATYMAVHFPSAAPVRVLLLLFFVITPKGHFIGHFEYLEIS